MIKTNVFHAIAFAASVTLALTGCASTAKPPVSQAQDSATEASQAENAGTDSGTESQTVQEAEETVTEPPVFVFSGGGIKCELEKFFLTNGEICEDENASGKKAVRLDSSSSYASAFVTLQKGKYELLLSEKAFHNKYAEFSLKAGEKTYKIYPSKPPLGFYELCIRTPVYIETEETKSFELTISYLGSKAQDSASGSLLDFIQIVRIKEEE